MLGCESVERLALEGVGIEPIRYVDNIEKYYVAYTLAYGLTQGRKAAVQELRQWR